MGDSSRPDRAGRRPTVQDVARLAGVSPMTVSRVLSGKGGVRPELRVKVTEAIAETGYRRNENARSLRPGHRSGLIGVTITNIANPYYAEMQLGIEEVAAAHARRILVGNSNEDPDRERQLVADFLGRQVEGLIVVPASTAEADHLRPEQLDGTPLVLASRAVLGLAVDTVLVDDVGGASTAVAALIAEGHRRIGYLGTSVSIFTGERRADGYRQAHARSGLPVDERLVRAGQRDVSSAEAAMDELLDLDDPPTAVFTANNRNTMGAIRSVLRRRRSGRDVPMRIFGFDPLEVADLASIPLSIVTHDPLELGRRAARFLIDRIDAADDSTTPPARLEVLPVQIEDYRQLTALVDTA